MTFPSIRSLGNCTSPTHDSKSDCILAIEELDRADCDCGTCR